jgi:hypothetical protein
MMDFPSVKSVPSVVKIFPKSLMLMDCSAEKETAAVFIDSQNVLVVVLLPRKHT